MVSLALLIDLSIPSRKDERRIWIALAISSMIVVIEFTGGFLGQSLALLSDSGHVLTDVLAISVSILTLRLGRMQHTAKRTFGYHRAEIFAALINGSTLIAVAFLIIYEAFLRFQQPTRVQGALVLSLASLGLLGNLTTTGLLARTGKTSLNVRGVFLHAVGDTVSSIAVIISSLVVVFTGYSGLDPIAAGLIWILINRKAYGLVSGLEKVLL